MFFYVKYMIKVELSRIIIDEKKHEQVVVLKESSGLRLVPIVVGISEAAAIRMHLSGVRPPRPLTHDLLHNVMEITETGLEKVVIDKLVDNTFHAKLYVSTAHDGVKIVDARPSDSIALAVRFNAPIFIAEAIFERLSQGA